MKEYYTWEQFDEDILKLTNLISNDVETIVAIACGGLPLGVTLKNKLGLPLQIVSAKSYNERNKKEKLSFNFSFYEASKSPILLVDDVADTGDTLKTIKDYIAVGNKKIETITLFYKPTSEVEPDIYLHETKRWVVFPWE